MEFEGGKYSEMSWPRNPARNVPSPAPTAPAPREPRPICLMVPTREAGVEGGSPSPMLNCEEGHTEREPGRDNMELSLYTQNLVNSILLGV